MLSTQEDFSLPWSTQVTMATNPHCIHQSICLHKIDEWVCGMSTHLEWGKEEGNM